MSASALALLICEHDMPENIVVMATANVGVNSISCSDSVSQTDNVRDLADGPPADVKVVMN